MEIKDIAAHVGGVVSLSKSLGLSRGAVSQWEEVPAERVLSVCALTNWRITPHQVRPDLYPNIGDGMPCNCEQTP